MKKDFIKPMSAEGVSEIVLKSISPLKQGKVLDASAGQGFLSEKLSELGLEVYPVDINPSNFRHKKLKCLKVDLNKDFPFEDNFFDLIVSVETIEHLENPWHFIRELHRVLKSGGQLIVTTPNITNIFSRMLFILSGRFILFSKKDIQNKHHIMPLPQWMLEGILEEEGFTIDKIMCNKGWIPIFRLYFNTKNLIFGHILLISATKMLE